MNEKMFVLISPPSIKKLQRFAGGNTVGTDPVRTSFLIVQMCSFEILKIATLSCPRSQIRKKPQE